MANQMIALGVRGPQLPNLAGAAAQYGNMMANMAVMKEKQAGIERANAFRQLVSDPGFDASNPEHVKAAQALDPAGAEKIVAAADARRAANLEYIGKLTQQFRDQLASIDPNDKAAYGALRSEIVAAVPGWGSRLPTVEQWGPDARVRTLMKADDVISKTIATPTASFQVSDTGVPQSVTVGGLAPSVQEMPQYRYQPDQPPAPAAAQTAAPAELTPQEAGPILQNATQTQTISEQDAARVRRSLGPQGQPQFDRWLQTNSIQVIPMAYIGNAGEMSPPMRTAEYREPVRDYFSNPGVADYPVENAPVNPLRQDIGYVPTTTRFKSPMQSPTPGSATVPLPRVRAEAEAGRPSEGETYRKGRAEEQAKSDVRFLEGIGAARESAQTALGVISSMIGDARLNKAGQIEIPRGGRPPHPGFEDVVGATWRPGARFIPGTDAADFDAYLEQVEGGAFLEAYERLKGTGQITEVEGEKATRAITRMKRSVSEVEFVKAAREFQGIIQSALDRAAQREAALNGTAPAAPRRTPVQKGASRELRFNPATGDFE